MESTIATITGTLVDKLGVSAESLTPDALFEDLDLDSLVLTELSVILRGRLHVVVDEDELVKTQTVRQLAALVDGKLAVR